MLERLWAQRINAHAYGSSQTAAPPGLPTCPCPAHDPSIGPSSFHHSDHVRTMSHTPPTYPAFPSYIIFCHLCDCLCQRPRIWLSHLRPCDRLTLRMYPTDYRLCLGLPTKYSYGLHALSPSSLPRCRLPSRTNDPSRPYSSWGSQTFLWRSLFHMLALRPLR